MRACVSVLLLGFYYNRLDVGGAKVLNAVRPFLVPHNVTVWYISLHSIYVWKVYLDLVYQL